MLKSLLLLMMAGGLMGQAGDPRSKADGTPQVVPITEGTIITRWLLVASF